MTFKEKYRIRPSTAFAPHHGLSLWLFPGLPLATQTLSQRGTLITGYFYFTAPELFIYLLTRCTQKWKLRNRVIILWSTSVCEILCRWATSEWCINWFSGGAVLKISAMTLKAALRFFFGSDVDGFLTPDRDHQNANKYPDLYMYERRFWNPPATDGNRSWICSNPLFCHC